MSSGPDQADPLRTALREGEREDEEVSDEVFGSSAGIRKKASPVHPCLVSSLSGEDGSGSSLRGGREEKRGSRQSSCRTKGEKGIGLGSRCRRDR